jgi:hypothetical protein
VNGRLHVTHQRKSSRLGASRGFGDSVFGVITAHIDSFWSPLKRGVMGQFHHVSEKYLPLYLNDKLRDLLRNAA